MKNRERFKKIMNFETPDRIPRIEFASYWDKTLERWYSEGLEKEKSDDIGLREGFGFDDYRQFWIQPYKNSCPEPPHHGAPVIGSDAGYSGIRKELYPMNAYDPRELEAAAEGQAAGDTVIWITLEGFFWFPRYLLGIEKHLYAFYDMPDLIHRINDELADYHCEIFEKIRRCCSPDFMTFAEDLSYNMGPMISKNFFDEFLLPYYRRVIPELDSAGTLGFVDTDGKVEEIIPWYEEAGMRGCLPVECNAGNDPLRIRKNHPGWLMIGGIEKRALYSGEVKMKEEVTRKFSLARGGGYIPSVDHQTPPEVSLEQYRKYTAELALAAVIDGGAEQPL
ncbi:MAG: hypothetical protein JEZ04_01050 [Spirochaetales bacterium]|nr:hypothetical protein [Spirochaetales bacterium]